MARKSIERFAQLGTYFRHRSRFLTLGILLSLLLHAAILVFMPAKEHVKPTQRVPITLIIKKKPKKPDNEPLKVLEKDQEKPKPKPKKEPPKSIIEAPLFPTQKPDAPAHLGRQDHRTKVETKLEPSVSLKGADTSSLQNGRLKVEGGLPDEKGSVVVPARQGKKYSGLLPREGEVLNLAHNDTIHDPKVGKGLILDVNTTDFRWLGYFTLVRKAVEMAFTDIGPTLRSSPYVKSRLSEAGKASFQGNSVVRLKVVRSGLLTETKLVSSSGDKDIDDFWNKILNVAAPYPPLPKDYPDDELMFTYTLYYDIVIESEHKVRRFVY
ncbi:MAG: TonB C-terminal domain-containing protein [Chitinophagaceae bacterium]|nr:TonB C-terminal domain-containing protein [Oligoflexus sp.]